MTTLEVIASKALPIKLRDPLGEFLGLTAAGQPIFYTLMDAGRFAGHLCPTVTLAFEMARAGLARLYPGSQPMRGEVRVSIASPPDAFANGPVGQVIGYITGAAGETGFKGISGRFNRQGLLRFDAGQTPFGSVKLERVDNRRFVRLLARPERLPPSPTMTSSMQEALAGIETSLSAFQAEWAKRIEIILKHPADYIDVVDEG